jgi:dTMP kinase
LSLFITLEGPDGSGKTTQARLLVRHLERRGLTVLCLREPGGTPVGEQIREVVLSKNNPSIRHETEALLFSAARAQIVAELIRPALERGEIVLCDRYADSTFAYQGYGLGLDLDALRTITRFATRGLVPDITFYIDVPVEAGIARKRRGETNRLDVKEIEYHERVRTGYLEMAHAEPERWIIVDGTLPVDEVQSQVRERLDQELGQRGILS